ATGGLAVEELGVREGLISLAGLPPLFLPGVFVHGVMSPVLHLHLLVSDVDATGIHYFHFCFLYPC
ncbi:hypothetical protein, partial [Salmonella enterica]|uniref:hypothetical protein n=1 Tax=Salmonella enterica TaxID=28901 RepID=UPI001C9913F0